MFQVQEDKVVCRSKFGTVLWFFAKMFPTKSLNFGFNNGVRTRIVMEENYARLSFVAQKRSVSTFSKSQNVGFETFSNVRRDISTISYLKIAYKQIT